MIYDTITLRNNLSKKKEYNLEIPSCKSIANRLLIIKSLSNSSSIIRDISTADDTQMLHTFIQELENKSSNTFYCKNAGTTLRFLLALLSLREGTWCLEADNRMQDRPLLPLINILNSLGGDITITNNKKIFPIVIKGKKLLGNKVIELKENLTSQIISALLLISPYIKGGITFILPHKQTSMPYVNMTIALVNIFGGHITAIDNTLVCRSSRYFFHEVSVEKDYSSASFFYLYVAVGKLNNIRIKDLQTSMLQGDSICAKLFKVFGVTTIFDEIGVLLSYNERLISDNQYLEFDLLENPDLFCPVAVASYISGKQVCIKNIASVKVKESNRLENMVIELNKLGDRCKMQEDSLIIETIKEVDLNRFVFDNNKVSLCKNNVGLHYDEMPQKIDNSLRDYINEWKNKTYFFKTYNDHRIAMSLSAIAFVCKSITIENPQCVAKSFPNFWQQINKIFNVNQLKI
ncbi:MAG: 3-phosphoshikimate 1-carboxyvinyltransferase [Bacteroidales bacterium]